MSKKIIDIKRWDCFIRCQNDYYTNNNMKKLLDNLDDAICHADIFLKKGNSSTVVKLDLEQCAIVIKRANLRNSLHAMRRLFQPSRAKKNWDYAERLKAVNIPTFEPIAMIEKRWGPFRRESYFISNYLAGLDLIDCFVKGKISLQQQKQVAREVVKLVKKLAKEGLYHRDLNLSNIILIDKQPHIIDLDSMQRYQKSFITEFLLKLKIWHRFMENIVDTVGENSIAVDLFREAYQLEK